MLIELEARKDSGIAQTLVKRLAGEGYDVLLKRDGQGKIFIAVAGADAKNMNPKILERILEGLQGIKKISPRKGLGNRYADFEEPFYFFRNHK